MGQLLQEVERRGSEEFRSVEQVRCWLLTIAARTDDAARESAETRGKGEHIQIVCWRERMPDELAQI